MRKVRLDNFGSIPLNRRSPKLQVHGVADNHDTHTSNWRELHTISMLHMRDIGAPEYNFTHIGASVVDNLAELPTTFTNQRQMESVVHAIEWLILFMIEFEKASIIDPQCL